MPAQLAFLLWFVFAAALFVRDRKNHPNLSRSLWIPLVWLFIIGSRSFSSWIHLNVRQAASIEAYTEGNALDRNFLILLFLVALVIAMRRRVRWSEVIQQNKIIFVFVLYCLISVVWSEFPLIAFKRLVRFLGIVPMCLIVLTEKSPHEAITVLLRRCSYLFISLSVLFIRWFPQLGRYYNQFTYEVSYCGVGGNKNELGMVCVVAALIFLWDLICARNKTKKFWKSLDTWTALGMLALTAYLAKISSSSTALFCIIVAAAILAATSLPALRKNPHTLVYQVGGASLAVAVFQMLFNVRDLIIRALGRDTTLTERTSIWKTLFGMVTNPILGTGYESFWTSERIAVMWQTGHGAIQAHNGYIDTYINLGIIGVAFFVALLGRCFMLAVREMPVHFEFNQLRLAFLIVYALYNYTEAAFPRTGLLLAFFFLLTFVIAKPAPEPVMDS
jgi:exopolysaccharide production protein ExoQ